MLLQPVQYKYTSTKEYHDAFPCAYRQWRADSHCNLNVLESQFDHILLVAEDDPELEFYKEMERRNLAKLTILPRLGCEGLADQLYRYVNGVYIPDMWGPAEAERLWCYRVEVRETQSNMAFREGHREWNEDLFA